MKIAGVEARRYSLPLDPPFNAAWDPNPRDRFDETIVVIDTDTGVRGFAGGAPVADIGLLASLLVGTELDAEAVFETCQAVDFHGGRPWPVEVAAHDALARAEGIPLWELLGAERQSFPAYASTGERLRPDARAERTLAWREDGVRAVKLRLDSEDWRSDVAVVAAVREAVGDSMDIMVDANQGWRMPGDRTPQWDLVTATECAEALAGLDVYWLEEPLPTNNLEDYVGLRQRAAIRIAAGEMVRTLAETSNLVGAGAFDIVQNDVVLAGGITGAARVAGWARNAGIVWSPHTWTTGLGLLANLHAALALSTAAYIEVPYDPPAWSPRRRDFTLAEPLEISADGSISPPLGPGLGVEPDLEALERWRAG